MFFTLRDCRDSWRIAKLTVLEINEAWHLEKGGELYYLKNIHFCPGFCLIYTSFTYLILVCGIGPLNDTTWKWRLKMQQLCLILRMEGSQANKIPPAKTRETLLFLFMSEVKLSKTCLPLFWGVCLIFLSLCNSVTGIWTFIAHKQKEATNVPPYLLWHRSSGWR